MRKFAFLFMFFIAFGGMALADGSYNAMLSARGESGDQQFSDDALQQAINQATSSLQTNCANLAIGSATTNLVATNITYQGTFRQRNGLFGAIVVMSGTCRVTSSSTLEPLTAFRLRGA